MTLLGDLQWAAMDHTVALSWSAAVLGYRLWRSVIREHDVPPGQRSLAAGRPMGPGEVGILIWAVTETGLTSSRIYSGHTWLSEVLLAALLRDLLYAVVILLTIIALDMGGRVLLVRGMPKPVRSRVFGLGLPSLIAVTTVVLDRGIACVSWTALIAMGLE